MWYNVPQAFSKEYCKEIVDYFSSKETVDATIEGANINKDIRDTKIKFTEDIANNNSFENNLHTSMDRLIKRVNSEWYNYDLNYNEAPQFGVYGSETKSFYDWHEDVLHQSTNKQLRKLSVVILLNDKDNYTGGNLELDHSEKPQNFNKAGDAVFFPSSLKHRVTPVETGTRYSLVCWSNGPPWR